MKFLSPEVALISVNLSYDLAWNVFIRCGTVHLAATWKCQISHRQIFRAVGPSLVATLEPWLIVQRQLQSVS